MNSFFYSTPLVAVSEKHEYTAYMLDLLKDCYNCFLLSLIEKHLNEPIIYYNFSFLITQSYLSLLNLLLFLSTASVILNDYFFQMAGLHVSAKQIFSVNKLYYVILQSFFCIQCFSWSRFFRVQVFQRPSQWPGVRF